MDTIILLVGFSLIFGSLLFMWWQTNREMQDLRVRYENQQDEFDQWAVETRESLNRRIDNVVNQFSQWTYSLENVKRVEDEKRRVADTKAVIKKLQDSIK
jgi:hypothetical protein